MGASYFPQVLALFALNLQVSVRNSDSVGHGVTVEVQKYTGGVRSLPGWVNSGETVTFKKIRGLLHGQKYHVYFDTPAGRTIACEGWIDQVRDTEFCIIRDRTLVTNEQPIDSLLGIAQLLEIDSKVEGDVMSLEDLRTRLGAVIVATRSDDGSYEHHAIIKLEDVQLTPRNDFTFRRKSVASRSALAALGSNPIFARLNISARSASYYSLSFDLARGYYGSTFEVQRALISADAGTIEAIRNALLGNPEAEVYYIQHFSTIENAVLTITESSAISAMVSVDAGVFIRADGRYVFDHRNEEIVRIHSMVVAVTPARVGTRAFMLSYLESRLRGDEFLDLGERTLFTTDRDLFLRGLRDPEIRVRVEDAGE